MRHLQDDSVFALGILSDFLSPRGLPAQHRKMLCPAFCLTLCCSRSNGHLFDEEVPLAVGIHCHLGSLTFDAHGNLFGTTDAGGVVSDQCTVGCGTVFELSPASGGGWCRAVSPSTLAATYSGPPRPEETPFARTDFRSAAV